MSSSFYAKDAITQDRQLKVQSLVIPFTVTASATPSAVVLRCDEPNIMFMQSEGVNQISAEVTALGDTASYTVSPVDASGTQNYFIVVGETVHKICQANVIDRVNGGSQPCKLGSATGLSSLKNMMLTMDASIDFTSTSGDLCLQVDYIVAD